MTAADDHNKTCIETALRSLSPLAMEEWGINAACQVRHSSEVTPVGIVQRLGVVQRFSYITSIPITHHLQHTNSISFYTSKIPVPKFQLSIPY